MTELIWNSVGERFFEAGVDRGVFFTSDGNGIVWNGLISVEESPSGNDMAAFYIDGVKYYIATGQKEFGGSIEAYTYPEEFAEYDGWANLGNGLSVDEQDIKAFGFAYRTRIGNDLNGQDHGYKIHLVYNVLATPADRAYTSLGEDTEPLTFSWNFSTIPVRLQGSLNSLSHVVIDSTKTNPTQLNFIESLIYGSATQSSTLPLLEELLNLFENPLTTLKIKPDPSQGTAVMFQSATMVGDLRGRIQEGLYTATESTRLIEKSTPGFFILTNPDLYMLE